MNGHTDLDLRMTDNSMYLKIAEDGEEAFELVLGDERWHDLPEEVQDAQLATAFQKLSELNDRVTEKIQNLIEATEDLTDPTFGEHDLDFPTPERNQPDFLELSRPSDESDRTNSTLESPWSHDNPFAPTQRSGLPDLGHVLLSR